MNLNNLDFEIKQARLEPSKNGGYNIVVSMVTVYQNGKYLKHAKLNEDLIKALNAKGVIGFNVNLDKLGEMKAKNPNLETLEKTLDLEVTKTDAEMLEWFKKTTMPLVPVRVSESTTIERPHDYVTTHLQRIESYGMNSLLTKSYLSHLRELYNALISQKWTL